MTEKLNSLEQEIRDWALKRLEPLRADREVSAVLNAVRLSKKTIKEDRKLVDSWLALVKQTRERLDGRVLWPDRVAGTEDGRPPNTKRTYDEFLADLVNVVEPVTRSARELREGFYAAPKSEGVSAPELLNRFPHLWRHLAKASGAPAEKAKEPLAALWVVLNGLPSGANTLAKARRKALNIINTALTNRLKPKGKSTAE